MLAHASCANAQNTFFLVAQVMLQPEYGGGTKLCCSTMCDSNDRCATQLSLKNKKGVGEELRA